ncbi:hypothetical protein H2200_002727 [Cladophialophora chaetospira]|uniref:Enoyl reductase (ER) domain-containing protein n=1 Tax=Cladophialophora chaetospira TaxID=386627 RepID=A0AA38XJE4_9EURO|nr:hypothetical protein H2200_002727 [Cladophialophora chaetospira]
MSLQNSVAWLDGGGKKLRIGPGTIGKPEAGQLLIRNHAVALNPVDGLIQNLGIICQQWPAVLGSDIAGEVVEVGEGVTGFKPGERVVAQALGLVTQRAEDGGFQQYTIVQAHATCPIPDSVRYEDAAVIPLAFSTAVGGLYQDQYLALQLPQLKPEKTDKTILVWSGSSSVGSAAIQLATASGVDVIVTASPKNFGYCKSLGAVEVFDHTDEDIVTKLAAAMRGKKVAGAFDAFASKGSTSKIAEILSRNGGGFIATVEAPPEQLPDNITAKQMYAALVPGTDVGKTLWKDFLPAALASGAYKPAPQAHVVGEGLEAIQLGLDTLKQGVSASKIVVDL